MRSLKEVAKECNAVQSFSLTKLHSSQAMLGCLRIVKSAVAINEKETEQKTEREEK